MIPYTYLIGWSSLNKWYYGVRYAKNCCSDDLMVTYFTSSKYVKKFIKDNGIPDIVEIRKTFDDINKARLWENKVLRRLNVINNDKWLNKTNNISIDYKLGILGSLKGASILRGKKQPLSQIKKKSQSLKGHLVSEITRKKLSDSRKGKESPRKGVKLTDETRQKISIARKTHKEYCLYCNGYFDLLNYNRWHNTKCKKNGDSSNERFNN